MNQELYLTASIQNRLESAAGVSTVIGVSVSIEGRNGNEEPWTTIVNNDTHTRPVTCVEVPIYIIDPIF